MVKSFNTEFQRGREGEREREDDREKAVGLGDCHRHMGKCPMEIPDLGTLKNNFKREMINV